MNKKLLSLVLVAAGFVVACGGGGSAGPNTLNGVVFVTEQNEMWSVEKPCSTSGDFADIREGTRVRATDPAGKQVGKSSLRQGRGEEDSSDDKEGSETHICEFAFFISGVQTTDGYTVTVGDRVDSSATYSLEDLKNVFWFVTFELPPGERTP